MLKDSKHFMLTYIIIASNMAVYLYTSVIGGNVIETRYDLIVRYGQVNFLIMYEGWYWQLFTAMFIHVNLLHLLGNMLFLFIFGLRAEELFAVHEYLLIYFSTGLAGNLLSLLFGPFAPPSAGASGAIFGLFGACTIYARRTIGHSIISALLYSLVFLMISGGTNVNYLAHIGGLVVGLLLGYVLGATRRLKRNILLELKARLYGSVRISTFTLCPSFNLRCFLRKTGAITSITEAS